MMKKYYIILLLLISLTSSWNVFSQKYGNEWINYSQTYYQFKIVEEGIYKIDYQTLVNNGINPTDFKSSNIQIFGKDKEQPILLFDNNDDNFNPGDYFLFYAERNDGWLDSTLYFDPSTIGNPAYSMFNDTIIYFFTWNNSSTNLRYKTENFNDFSSNPKISPFVLAKSEVYYKDEYNVAYTENGLSYSLYTPGEGFASGKFSKGSTVNPTFSTPNLYTGTGAPMALFHGKFNSNSNAGNTSSNITDNHHTKWTIGLQNYQLIDTTFKGYRQFNLNNYIPVNQLNSGSTSTTFQIIDDLTAITDFQTLSYMSLIFPKTCNLSGLNKDKFWLKDEAFQSKINLEIRGTNISSPIILVTGGVNSKHIVPVNIGNNDFNALITNSANGKDQKLIIQDTSLVKKVTTLALVNGTGMFTDFSTINFDSSNIMIYHKKLKTASELYRNYRMQDYNVVFADIDELYLQFGGGIVKHNASIRRFSLFIYENATIKPLAITLLGKGLNTISSRSNSTNFNQSLIPCFGYPGSDVCYTANTTFSTFAPLIPIGRISVETETEILDYLDKLKSYELQQNQNSIYNSATKDWQKQIIHFAGGNPGLQQELFFTYMEGFRYTIEDSLFAGHVNSFEHKTKDPFDPPTLSKISKLFENGVSIINFFGHSNADGFDITIDKPENWNNKDKYPVVIGNGCYSGNIFGTNPSIGEVFLATKQGGAIAFVASTDQEYDISVRDYCGELYRQISYKNYGKPLSQQIKETIKYLENNSNNYLLKGTFGATNLNGDPLLKVNYHKKPEIEITEQSLYFKPDNIDLTVDSIELNLVIKNLGKSVTDTFYLDISRRFPNSTFDSNYRILFNKLNYVDSFKLKIPLQANIAVGINKFNVSIDLDPELIEEQYDEISNNQLSKNLFIKLDAIVPIYPFEFAVIPNNTVTLKASTINPIGPERKYLFELDTSYSFNSPEKRVFSKTGLGGVQEIKYSDWKDKNGTSYPLVCKDSFVYYWRAAIDSSVIVWNESSFQYIKGKEGWGQDHFFQFKNNDFYVVKFDSINRRRVFEANVKLLEATVFDNTVTALNHYRIDQQSQEYANLPQPDLHLAVIDNLTLKAWFTSSSDSINDEEVAHYIGNRNHKTFYRQQRYFLYSQDSLGLNNLNNALKNQIPSGHYVLLYTSLVGKYSEWDRWCPELYNTLAAYGATNIITDKTERGFIFASQKDNPVRAKEKKATTDGEEMLLKFNLETGFYSGIEVSPFIGPAKNWKALYWKQFSEDAINNDSTRLKIELYTKYQTLATTIDTVFSSNDSIINLSNLINATNFPYIRLKADYTDKLNFTPAQNDRWHVLFQPMPEAAIDGSTGITWLPKMDTLNEGQEYKFAVDIKNISDYPMDSLLISYWIEDHKLEKHYLTYPRQDSLKVNQIIRDTIQFSTLGYPGQNSLWVEVNPYINGSSIITDQPEQFHFNNLLQIPFYVRGDDVNPILDVTFNGRHILNGDIVDPKSEIYISLKDDNPYLIMNDISDTTLFGIFLTSPDGSQKRIPFLDGSGNQILQWIPAESNYKKFKIIYQGNFEKDGKYTLLVQGSDRSGNISGDLEYRISFEVIHESSITYLMNYPNPFSTSTRFVFTLTGSVIPEDFLIQILTVSGKVVKQINEQELGPIYIGRNITEYAWDGTDDFGDPLANGVYIYRVLSRLNGEEIKHRDTGGDKYFTKEYGKMYLFR